ncbi:hypothetical protein niasHT_012416 [Heterodera trifolii]|uniref:Uncharacterized protein n=1 Tax=Heterodera trifolii TaxID=157864 RepID=A0ABD2LAU6_9BILA
MSGRRQGLNARENDGGQVPDERRYDLRDRQNRRNWAEIENEFDEAISLVQMDTVNWLSECQGDEHSNCCRITLGKIFTELPNNDPLRRLPISKLSELICLHFASDVLHGQLREWAAKRDRDPMALSKTSAQSKFMAYTALSDPHLFLLETNWRRN